jgi:hypothetical protein
MTRATRTSSNSLPIPKAREPLHFEGFFTDADAERITNGLIPQAMEDKWFVYFEDGWLHFCRSWTGIQIYGVRLDGSPGGVRVVDSWVNGDPQQYTAFDAAYDRRLLRFLIDALLLNRRATFPLPVGWESAPLGLVQHVLVGRAYPEQNSTDEA